MAVDGLGRGRMTSGRNVGVLADGEGRVVGGRTAPGLNMPPGRSLMLGCNCPPTSRLADEKTSLVPSAGVNEWTAEARRPSASTPFIVSTQLLPCCTQVPSLNVPSESKTHERICLAAGS